MNEATLKTSYNEEVFAYHCCMHAKYPESYSCPVGDAFKCPVQDVVRDEICRAMSPQTWKKVIKSTDSK